MSPAPTARARRVAFLRAFLEAAGYRVHVYTSPHLVRFNERIRLAGKLIDEDALWRAARGMRARQCRRAHHLLRDHHGRGLPRLRAQAGRRRAARDRAGRAVRRDQRDRASRGHGDHAGLARPSAFPRRHGGARSRSRRPASSSRASPAVLAPQTREAAAVLEARAQRGRRAALPPRRRMVGRADADGRPRLSRPARRSTCRRRGCSGRINTTMPARRSPASIASPGFTCPTPALARGIARGRMAGAAAAPDARAAARRSCRRTPSSGSTARITRPAARRSRAWRRGWRDRPLHLVFGMLTRTTRAASWSRSRRSSTALAAVAIPGEANARPAEELAAAAAPLGIAPRPRAGIAAAVAAAAAPGARVLICGSLYLAGRVLAENGAASSEDRVRPTRPACSWAARRSWWPRPGRS